MPSTVVSVSNNLTDLGKKYFFDLLFDDSLGYNKMFFSDPNTQLKLRLYNQYNQYVISEDESIELNSSNEIEMHYKFTIPEGTVMDIITVRLLDPDGYEIMVIKDVGLSSVSTNGSYNSIEDVVLLFKVQEVTKCITNIGLSKINNALINQELCKITKLYLGSGVPDLSGASSILTSKVLDSAISNVNISGSTANIRVYTKLTSNITELGLGYDLSDQEYVLIMIQEVDFLANDLGSGDQIIMHKLTVE